MDPATAAILAQAGASVLVEIIRIVGYEMTARGGSAEDIAARIMQDVGQSQARATAVNQGWDAAKAAMDKAQGRAPAA